MSELPYITTTTDDETQILACLNKQMDEHQLFQFLNDLQEVYRAQRSHMLISPLPSVEVTVSYTHLTLPTKRIV